MQKFNIIASVCANLGLGLKGKSPWKLKSELQYFNNTTKKLQDPNKNNVIIMEPNSFFEFQDSKCHLPHLLNIVLSTTLKPSDLPENVLLYPNLETAVKFLETDEKIKNQIETIWIGGGVGIYDEAMASDRCHRLYLTKIHRNFPCDTFFPKIPDEFKEVELDPDTPRGMQVENNIKFEHKILEKTNEEAAM